MVRKRRLLPKREVFINNLLEHDQIGSVNDVQEMQKGFLGDILQDMLGAEMSQKPIYFKYDY